jgi:hypothetical protein
MSSVPERMRRAHLSGIGGAEVHFAMPRRFFPASNVVSSEPFLCQIRNLIPNLAKAVGAGKRALQEQTGSHRSKAALNHSPLPVHETRFV